MEAHVILVDEKGAVTPLMVNRYQESDPTKCRSVSRIEP